MFFRLFSTLCSRALLESTRETIRARTHPLLGGPFLKIRITYFTKNPRSIFLVLSPISPPRSFSAHAPRCPNPPQYAALGGASLLRPPLGQALLSPPLRRPSLAIFYGSQLARWSQAVPGWVVGGDRTLACPRDGASVVARWQLKGGGKDRSQETHPLRGEIFYRGAPQSPRGTLFAGGFC